jgi:hypothetical protein
MNAHFYHTKGTPDYHVDSSGLVVLNFDEVRSFIQKLKDPQFLLDGCVKFIEIEPRDSMYVLALSSVESNRQPVGLKAPGRSNHALSWNARITVGRERF